MTSRARAADLGRCVHVTRSVSPPAEKAALTAAHCDAAAREPFIAALSIR